MECRLCFALAVTLVVPLFGDENLKPTAQVSNTERIDFSPGGTIRIDRADGDLYVEGWDQPQVEMTIIKSLPYEHEASHPQRLGQQLEAVQVASERPSPSELIISMHAPARYGWLWHPTSPVDTSHVKLEYQLHVPRDSKLVIDHGVGLVSVRGVTGDIHASCGRGDIVLWLPSTGTYSIDARSRLGKVYSDFPGDSISEFLVGQKFTNVNSTASQRLFLRAGYGGITLKPILAESEAPVTEVTK